MEGISEINTLMSQFQEDEKKRVDAGEENPHWKTFFWMMEKGCFMDPHIFRVFFLSSYRRSAPSRAEFLRLTPYLQPEKVSDFPGLEARERSPEKITIYRGASEMEGTRGLVGPSWTLNRGVAEFFAFRYPIETGEEKKVIYSATVNKDDVLVWLFSDQESEVLILVDPRNVAVIAEEPTACFEDYLRQKEKRDRAF